MLINSISDFRKAMRHGPYAWPGGYPCYFVLSDGEALSFKGVKQILRDVLEAIRDKDDWCGYRVIGLDVNWEDTGLFCAQTGEAIESAYGED
jgi:hypothetical protein